MAGYWRQFPEVPRPIAQPHCFRTIGGDRMVGPYLAVSAHHSKEEWRLHHHDEVARRFCFLRAPIPRKGRVSHPFPLFESTFGL